MYASWQTKFIVGVFALIGIVALLFLSLRLGRVELFSNSGYVLYANFDDISGLKSGDQVEIAGVRVGKVVAIGLKNYRANVAMRINDGVKVDTDAIASIMTSGIIGDKYVSISIGAGENNLPNGGVIKRTQSAFNLETAVGQLINSSGSGSSPGDAGADHGKSVK